MIQPSRLRAASKAAFLHLILSMVVAAVVAALVFGVWFSWPYQDLSAGRNLFWLVMSANVVCGPLLTLVLFSPTKPRRELVRDLALVVVIQLAAVGYGLHTLALARPVALVFEVDRFRALSLPDLDKDELSAAPGWVSAWSWSGPHLVGTRAARNGKETLESIDKSMNGIDIGQRPSWWQDYALSVPEALARAKPISELVAKHPDQRPAIDAAVARTGQPESSLRWLPLVSHHALDWTALIDARTAEPIGYLHLDGF